jgi:hypothetical protein
VEKFRVSETEEGANIKIKGQGHAGVLFTCQGNHVLRTSFFETNHEQGILPSAMGYLR